MNFAEDAIFESVILILLVKMTLQYWLLFISSSFFFFFRIWKNIALSQTADNETDYETWDYPIREEFRHSLSMIEQNNPVPNARIGFKMVDYYSEFMFLLKGSKA